MPADGRNLLPSKGPTLSILVEIEPELYQGRDEMIYEIASDTLSPTMTVSSVDPDEPEEEDDAASSHSLLELVRLPT